MFSLLLASSLAICVFLVFHDMICRLVSSESFGGYCFCPFVFSGSWSLAHFVLVFTRHFPISFHLELQEPEFGARFYNGDRASVLWQH